MLSWIFLNQVVLDVLLPHESHVDAQADVLLQHGDVDVVNVPSTKPGPGMMLDPVLHPSQILLFCPAARHHACRRPGPTMAAARWFRLEYPLHVTSYRTGFACHMSIDAFSVSSFNQSSASTFAIFTESGSAMHHKNY